MITTMKISKRSRSVSIRLARLVMRTRVELGIFQEETGRKNQTEKKEEPARNLKMTQGKRAHVIVEILAAMI